VVEVETVLLGFIDRKVVLVVSVVGVVTTPVLVNEFVDGGRKGSSGGVVTGTGVVGLLVGLLELLN
jgi:hypothetical protein